MSSCNLLNRHIINKSTALKGKVARELHSKRGKTKAGWLSKLPHQGTGLDIGKNKINM